MWGVLLMRQRRKKWEILDTISNTMLDIHNGEQNIWSSFLQGFFLSHSFSLNNEIAEMPQGTDYKSGIALHVLLKWSH